MKDDFPQSPLPAQQLCVSTAAWDDQSCRAGDTSSPTSSLQADKAPPHLPLSPSSGALLAEPKLTRFGGILANLAHFDRVTAIGCPWHEGGAVGRSRRLWDGAEGLQNSFCSVFGLDLIVTC